MECPKCGFIEQRDVQCPSCDSRFNATEAEEWAHLDYLQSKLGEWRERGVLPEQKVEELLAFTDRDLAAVEKILGLESEAESAGATPAKPHPASAPAPDEDKILDAVDNALARGDTQQAERLLHTVETPAELSQSDELSAQFEPVDTDTGLDMLFLVTSAESAPAKGEHFRRAIVYASSAGQARRQVCAYIDLCNEAAPTQANEDDLEDSDDEQVTAEPLAESGPIGYEPDQMTATVLATTTTRLDDESAFDADHILIFETDWND